MITIIFAILFALKVAGVTTISWFIVFLPLLFPLFMSLGVLILAFITVILRSR